MGYRPIWRVERGRPGGAAMTRWRHLTLRPAEPSPAQRRAASGIGARRGAQPVATESARSRSASCPSAWAQCAQQNMRPSDS
jgi:hypothetical protein